MWNPNHIWARHMVYRYLGIQGNVIPKNLGGTYLYEGNVLEVETYASKTNRLYRIYVACACGKRVAFCKMPQHIQGKRHLNYLATLNTMTAEDQDDSLAASDRKEMKEEFLSNTCVPCSFCKAGINEACKPVNGETWDGIDYHNVRCEEAYIERLVRATMREVV